MMPRNNTKGNMTPVRTFGFIGCCVGRCCGGLLLGSLWREADAKFPRGLIYCFFEGAGFDVHCVRALNAIRCVRWLANKGTEAKSTFSSQHCDRGEQKGKCDHDAAK